MEDSLLDKLISMRIEKSENGKRVSRSIFSESIALRKRQSLIFSKAVISDNVLIPKVSLFLLLSSNKYRIGFANIILDVDDVSVQLDKELFRYRLGVGNKYLRDFDLEKYAVIPLVYDFYKITGINIEISKKIQFEKIIGFIVRFKEVGNQSNRMVIKEQISFINLTHAISEVSQFLMSNEIDFGLIYEITKQIANDVDLVEVSNHSKAIKVKFNQNKALISIASI